MSPHDRVRVYAAIGGVVVECRCGKQFLRPTEDQARAAHDHHHGLEQARDALNGPHLHVVEGD